MIEEKVALHLGSSCSDSTPLPGTPIRTAQ